MTDCVSDRATDNTELQSDRQHKVTERQLIQSYIYRVADCVSDGATDSASCHAKDSVSDRAKATDGQY